jgi:DNA-directed RNA polymerase alpha subunit
MKGDMLMTSEQESQVEAPQLSFDSWQKIAELEDWSTRLRRSLVYSGIEYLGQIDQYREKDVLRVHNFGKSSLQEQRVQLDFLGAHFGMDEENYPELKVFNAELSRRS